MKSVKNSKSISNLTNQLAQFNQKVVVGGEYGLIIAAVPPPPPTRINTGLKINSAKDNG